VLLLVHGLGAHSQRWEFLGDFFLENNISSYAIELRGFGETEEHKGHIDSFKTYSDDILTLRDVIARENGNKKIFLTGESMGALIAFLIALRDKDFGDALICLSPAFASKLKASPLYYLRIFLSFFYNPKKQFTVPFDSEMCTRDPECRKRMNEDKREHRLATSKLMLAIVKAQLKSLMMKKKIGKPVLFLLAGKDMLVNPRVSKRIFNATRAQDKTLLEYPEMYHAISVDTGREKVFQDMLNWIRGRI